MLTYAHSLAPRALETTRSPAGHLHNALSVSAAIARSQRSLAKADAARYLGQPGAAFRKTVRAGMHLGEAGGAFVGKALDLVVGNSRPSKALPHPSDRGPATSVGRRLLLAAERFGSEGLVGGIDRGAAVAAATALGAAGSMVGAVAASVSAAAHGNACGTSAALITDKMGSGWQAGRLAGANVWAVLRMPLRVAVDLVRIVSALAKMGLMALGGALVGSLAVAPAALMSASALLTAERARANKDAPYALASAQNNVVWDELEMSPGLDTHAFFAETPWADGAPTPKGPIEASVGEQDRPASPSPAYEEDDAAAQWASKTSER